MRISYRTLISLLATVRFAFEKKREFKFLCAILNDIKNQAIVCLSAALNAMLTTLNDIKRSALNAALIKDATIKDGNSERRASKRNARSLLGGAR